MATTLNHRRYRWTPLTDAFIPGNKNRSSICTLVRETCSTMKINLRVEERHTVLHRSRAHRRLFSEINAAFRRKRRRPSFFLFLFFERGSNVSRRGRGNRLVFRFSRWNLFRNISYKAGRSNEKDSVKGKFKESSVTFS